MKLLCKLFKTIYIYTYKIIIYIYTVYITYNYYMNFSLKNVSNFIIISQFKNSKK